MPKKSKDQKSVAKNVPTIGSYSPTDLETDIFDYWSKNDIFAKSMEQRKGAKPFVFLEGPPTANGKPGIHHVMARTFKDLVCRWKTMQGFLVERKAGWDTHGLPVEIEVQKRLDLGTNQEIEQYGIEKFNKEKLSYTEMVDKIDTGNLVHDTRRKNIPTTIKIT